MHDYFFEIGIYRIDDGKFHKQRESAISKAITQHTTNHPGLERERWDRLIRDEKWRTYGGSWTYNQIIGWVKLYVMDLQIRGELWLHKAKRYSCRIPNKRFEYCSKVFELWLHDGMSNNDIFILLRKELISFIEEFQNGNRTLDLTAYDRIAIHVDWWGLVKEHAAYKAKWKA